MAADQLIRWTVLRYLSLFPALYLAAVLNTSLAGSWAIGPVTPDMVALVGCGWLLAKRGGWVVAITTTAGITADLLSPGRLGVAMLCYLAAGLAVTQLRQRITLNSPLVDALLVAAFTCFVTFVPSILDRLGASQLLQGVTLSAAALGTALYTAGVALPMLMVVSWLRPGRTQQLRMPGLQ